MNDDDKSKSQLIDELEKLRGKLRQMEMIQASNSQGLERIITLASARLIALETGQIDAAIDDVLAEVGTFCGVDRSYIFLFSNDGLKFSNTHEWCAPEIAPQIHNLQDVPVTGQENILPIIKEHGFVYIPEVSSLPPQSSTLKDLLEPQGIQSLVLVPLSHAGKVMGFAGFDSVQNERYWQPDEINLLRVTANIIANALARKQSEEILLASEERYRSLIERMLDGIYRSTHAGKFVDINPAMVKMFGYDSTEEMLAIDIKKELYFDESERGSHILDTGQQEIDIYRMRRKDGSEIWVEDRGYYVHDEQNNIIFHEGMLRDVTERMYAEEALRQSEARYRELADSITDVFYAMDKDLRYTFWNKASEQLTGIPASEAIGKNFLEVFPDTPENQNTKSIYRQVLKNGHPRVFTSNYQTPDKILVFEINVYPSTSGISIFVKDITERRQTENALRESEAHNRAIVSALPDLLFQISADNYFVDCRTSNHAELLFPPEQVIGSKVEDLLPPRLAEETINKVRQTLSSGKMQIYEYTLPIHGVEQHFETRMTVLGPNIVQAVVRDITRQKKSEEAFKKASREVLRAYDATLLGWSNALELREHETAGHSKRVVALTLELARVMGIKEQDLVHIQRGALLHDIGKMGIPDYILLKPEPLTDEEWLIMRQHPKFAYQMLAGISYLEPALDIPYCHHERWNGNGYPQGLKGEEIPLPARIFAVVDAWDALLYDRPYRTAWSEKKVLAYLQEQAGSLFDPQVVEQFAQIIQKKRNIRRKKLK